MKDSGSVSIEYQTVEDAVNAINDLANRINSDFEDFGKSVLYVVGEGGNVGAMANSYRQQYELLKPTLEEKLVPLVRKFASTLNTASEMEDYNDMVQSRRAEMLNKAN